MEDSGIASTPMKGFMSEAGSGKDRAKDAHIKRKQPLNKRFFYCRIVLNLEWII